MEHTNPDLTPVDSSLSGGIDSSEKRAGLSEAQRAEQEAQNTFTQLLDGMEQSVATQGQYFAKIGEKKPITKTEMQETRSGFLGRNREEKPHEVTIGHEDTRSLILKAPLKEGDGNMAKTKYVVVTPDGLKQIYFYDQAMSEPETHMNRSRLEERILKALIEGDDTVASGAIFQKTESGSWLTIENGTPYDNGRYRPEAIRLHNLEAPAGKTPDEMFKQALKDSIAITESPFKKRVEVAEANKQSAVSALEAISGLPPRE